MQETVPTSALDLSSPVSESIRTLNQFIQSSVLKALYTAWTGTVPQVTVCGFLGKYEDKLWKDKAYYGVVLQEHPAKGEKILLQIPAELLRRSRLQAGDYVRVVGLLRVHAKYKSPTFELRIHVAEIGLSANEPDHDQHRLALLNLQKVLSLSRKRIPFPTKRPLQITLIYPESDDSDVRESFLVNLSHLKQEVKIEFSPVNIHDTEEILSAIGDADGDILVIAHESGPEDDFQIFDSEQIVSAMALKNMYRVAGLGSSEKPTLLDWVCDFSANTPAAVGAHIADMILHPPGASEERQRELEEQNERLRTELELQKKWQSARTEPKFAQLEPPSRAGRAVKLILIIAAVLFAAAAIFAVITYFHPAQFW